MLHIVVLSKYIEVPPRSFHVWCDFHTLVIVKERSCSNVPGKWIPYIQSPPADEGHKMRCASLGYSF